MSKLSLTLARALEKGRIARPPATRATVLSALLRKRATAHGQGAKDLEAMLREQILWALPIERGE